MTRKIVVDANPDPNINKHDRRTGLTPLHIAVKNLVLDDVFVTTHPDNSSYRSVPLPVTTMTVAGVIGCIKRGANVNAHMRGTTDTPLDFLLSNATYGLHENTCEDPNRIAEIARILLENGAEAKQSSLLNLSGCLLANRANNQLVTMDRDTRNALWMVLALCSHYCVSKDDLNKSQKSTLQIPEIFLTMPLVLIDAIIDAALVKQFNIAVSKGLIDDAVPVTSYKEIGIAAKERAAAETAANLEKYCVPGTTAETMQKAAMTVQFALLRRGSQLKVEARKEEVAVAFAAKTLTMV